MPLIVSPGQLTQRGELYHQLASLTAAGIPLISALETLRDAPPSRAFRRPLGQVINQLNRGSTLSEALRLAAKDWMPSFDLALIEAGESSGRLDACFRFLSEYYHERARLARQVLSDLAYPALVLHFAVLIFPTSLLIGLVWQGEVQAYLLAKGALLLPLYAAVAFLLYISQSGRNERWRWCLERVVRSIPVLGAARRSLALARLSMALESLLNAGVSIIEAWELAAAASGSPMLRRTVFAWKPNVLAGQTPSEAVRESGAFPVLFANLYNTGEISGQLDDTLRRLYRHYQEEGLRQLHAVAQWAPKIVYLVLVLVIAYQVISFWSRYFNQIGEITS